MPNTEYVVLAQYAQRLRARGFRHVMIRTCGPIVRPQQRSTQWPAAPSP